ncbi:MAG: amidase domain-containing protein [Pirellula sp.]
MGIGKDLGIVGATAAVVVLARSAPVDAVVTSLDRNVVVSVANQYVNHGNNPYEHPYFNSDCTNYVSFVWEFSGTPQNNQWFDYPVAVMFRNTSLSWMAVREFSDYHTVNHYENGGIFATKYPTDESAFNGLGSTAALGDAVMYDWNDGGPTTDHLSTYTGYMFIGTYWDARYSRAYNLNHDYKVINQHTYDRQYAPWNFGFLENKYYGTNGAWTGMDYKLIHVNT